MLNKALQPLGLSAKEARVYLAILSMGSGGLSGIATKSEGNRSSLYPILDTLLEKKFITISIQGKRKVYQAAPPEEIKHLLKEKLSAFDDILPGLLSMANKSRVKPVITFREGFEGIKEAFRDTLKAKDKVVLAFCAPDVLTRPNNRALQVFWENEYIPKRTKSGRLVKIIFPDDKVARAYHEQDGPHSSRESRFVPLAQYPFECEIQIYDDVVVFVSYNEHEEFALRVKSGPIARTMKLIWQIVWNVAY